MPAPWATRCLRWENLCFCQARDRRSSHLLPALPCFHHSTGSHSQRSPAMLHPPLPNPLQSLHHLHQRPAAAMLLHAIPPMTALPPPVLPSSEPAPGVDLDVDFATEVAPFLGRCLVGGACVIFGVGGGNGDLAALALVNQQSAAAPAPVASGQGLSFSLPSIQPHIQCLSCAGHRRLWLGV